MADKIHKADAEWRAQLTPEQYHTLRQKGTERPFTGRYVHEKAAGVYVCAGCGQPLFSSETKFDSGSGWPSFWDVIQTGSVELKTDLSHFMVRTEVICARIAADTLGHLFEDGPRDRTGLRYCINSTSLDLKQSE